METFLASDLPTETFIPGLGDGYVVEVEQDVECCSFDASNRYGGIIGRYTVVTFHDADGNENYLLLNPDVPVEVQR